MLIIINIPVGKGMLLNFPVFTESHGTSLTLYYTRETSALGCVMKDTFRKFQSEISTLLLMNYILNYLVDTNYKCNYSKRY